MLNYCVHDLYITKFNVEAHTEDNLHDVADSVGPEAGLDPIDALLHLLVLSLVVQLLLGAGAFVTLDVGP